MATGSLGEQGFPFNDSGGDRTYNATTWAEYFDSIFETGVVPRVENECEVIEADTPAKEVVVQTGYVLIKGHMYYNNANKTLGVSDNTSGSTRIDRVVARLDTADRLVEIAILQGTPGDGAPALTQTSVTWEISLAQLYLSDGYSTITNGDITNDRTFTRSRIIIDSDFLNGESPSYYLARANHTGTQPSSTISDFLSSVRGTVLTGLDKTINAVITASDTILSALGKLQKQISDNKSTADSHIASTDNPHSVNHSQVGAAPSSHVGGTGSEHGQVTTSVNGFMISSDKNKLDGIDSGAEVNDVNSVNGYTGVVVLDKADVGLSNVDNINITHGTSDPSGGSDGDIYLQHL